MTVGKEKAGKITTLQTTVIIVSFMLAAGLLTLPRVMVEDSRTPDVWISIILAGGVVFLSGWIMVKLSQRFPESTFYQYVQRIIGKTAGKVIGLLLVIYFICIAGFSILKYGARSKRIGIRLLARFRYNSVRIFTLRITELPIRRQIDIQRKQPAQADRVQSCLLSWIFLY
ncbi:GerAB/ArcD/ProY family transporter [Paenibacillus sp. 1-18]|uniref:GerAB/ArcD/ProY family transporter n=1 Tax=Paenibacillus sp. 1-18 TaxID=1333846 RepID=UPI0004714FDC